MIYYVRYLTLTTFLVCSMSSAVSASPQEPALPYFGWLTYNSPNFTFFYAPDSCLTKRGAVEKFADGRENALAVICNCLGIQPQQRIYFYAYDSNEIGRKYTGRNLGWAESNKAVIHSRINQTLGHEVCHIAMHWYRRPGAGTRSWIIGEGFATFMDLTGRDHLRKGYDLLKDENLPSLAELDKATGPKRSYSVAASFVAFLINAYGFDRFLLAEQERWNSLEHFLQGVYGISTAQMNRLWRSYLIEYDRATRVQPNESYADFAGPLEGTWTIYYSNDARRTYVFAGMSKVFFVEEGRQGRVSYREGFAFIEFNDNKLERWAAPKDKDRFDVFHYFPKKNFPKTVRCTAVAWRVK